MTAGLVPTADPRVRDFDPGRVARLNDEPHIPSARIGSPRPTVADLMSTALFTLPPDAYAIEAVEHLVGRDSEIVVLTRHGRPLGVLTARDLVRTGGVGRSRDRVDTLLPSRTRRLLPGLDIATAAAVLAEEAVDAAVVVDRHGALIGVLATRHIVGWVAGSAAPTTACRAVAEGEQPLERADAFPICGSRNSAGRTTIRPCSGGLGLSGAIAEPSAAAQASNSSTTAGRASLRRS